MEILVVIALIVVGLGLIAAEVYLIPGLNVVGALGFIFLVFAVGYAFYEGGNVGGVITLITAVGSGGGLFYWMWNSGAWDRFVLETNLRGDADQAARESEHRARYLGKSGVALTPLRPTGVADIEGERIEVMTEGEFIAAGSRVRVVAMDRRRFFVRLADSLAERAPV